LGIAAAVVVVAALYFARVVFIPLALAVLVALLLTPAVEGLERLKLPRLLSILLVVAGLAGLMGFTAWRIFPQFVDLTYRLPDYESALQNKIQGLKGSRVDSFAKASASFKQLERELGSPPTTSEPEGNHIKSLPASSQSKPLDVQVVPPTNPLESAENFLGPLATAGVVVVFALFIMLDREDLRNRLIRIAYGGRLNVMTQAMLDAVRRINRYLFLQLDVNIGYGIVIGTALHFVGVPNAALWGLLAGVLRFLPYVGAPLAALMPFVLALAVFPGWAHASLVAGIFLVLELVVANLVEPLLYGPHVGLSPLAILVAAVFWTLIWGFPGLILSTPLTVCLVVIGRYVPSLSYLNILLGNEEVLPAHAQFYQRLLARDQEEATQIAEVYLKENNLEDLYTSVVIPALSLAEQDRHRNELDMDTQRFIFQSTREIVDDLDGVEIFEPSDSVSLSRIGESENSGSMDVLCIPARDEADEIVAALLNTLLAAQGKRSQVLPVAATAEILAQVRQLNPKLVCISALPPFAMNHTRSLYAALQRQSAQVPIIVCLWRYEGDPQKVVTHLRLSQKDSVFSTLSEVLRRLTEPREASAAEPEPRPAV